MLLQGISAIVTGGARGLGYACAERFLAEGARVVIADINDELGEAAAERLKAGGDIRYQHCDVTRKTDVQALVDAAVDAFGRLDCAIANAGIVRASDPLELSEEDFNAVLDVNLKGVFLTGQTAAQQMVKQVRDVHGRRGTIVNMSSCQARIVIPEIAPYVISKGGINQWTKALGIRLAKEGIRVNAIGPGSINTEMFRSIALDPEKMRNVMSRTPMGRVGEPDEVGNVAVFLASNLSSYITGECVYVDGGRLGLNYTVSVDD